MDSDGPSTVALTVGAARWRILRDDPEALCRRAVQAVLAHPQSGLPAGLAACEVSLLLTDDGEIAALNGRYRGQPRPTNVLAFPALPLLPHAPPQPLPPGPVLLGDIVLSIDTLAAEAAAMAKPLADHFCHLVVHGTLHLLGHDHPDDAAAAAMEALETAILADLGIADPYHPAADSAAATPFADVLEPHR